MQLRRNIIIGLDPGTNNFGFSVMKFVRGRPVILETGLLTNTVNYLTNDVFLQLARKFCRVVKYLIEKWGPFRIIVERFINRGRFFAALVEKISIMIGMIERICRRYKVHLLLVTAAAWKNQFHRTVPSELKLIYKQFKPLPPHCIDSALLSMYGYTKIDTYRYFRVRLLHRIKRKWQTSTPNA